MVDKREKGEYIQHFNLEDLKIRFKFIQLRDEQKILRNFIDNEQIKKDYNLDLMATTQLILNEKPVEPAQINTFKTMLLDQIIQFPVTYKEIPYHAKIAITIWCTNNSWEDKKPLGASTISLFDEEFKLREGKYHLYIWPNTLPDYSFDSKTPGLVLDQNIKEINFGTQQQDYYKNKESLCNLDLKVFYTYQKIPAAFLTIEFPKFQIPVFYEDCEYQENEQWQQIVQNQQTVSNQATQKQQIKQMFIQPSEFSECIIANDFDFEFNKNDPVEQQQYLYFRDEESIDPKTIRPNNQENEQLKKIIKKPLLGDLNEKEKLLLWRYRYVLKDNKEALVKFLSSFNWQKEKEYKEAMILLKQWAPCDYPDALYLLSNQFCANDLYNKKNKKPQEETLEVRQYAVTILNKTSNQQITDILLQLVQALRYEPYTADKSALVQFLIEKASGDLEIATAVYWYISVECDTQKDKKESLSVAQQQVTGWYSILLKKFEQDLSFINNQIFMSIQYQKMFREKLKKLNEELKSKCKDRKERIIRCKEILDERGTINFFYKFSIKEEWKTAQLPQHPFCLDTNVKIIELLPKDIYIFKSAMAPLKLSFLGRDGIQKQDKKVEFIFKNGDDMRQDQLVLQILSIMDQCLKQVNIDLKLTKYKVLACSKSDGFMQFVPHTKTLQDIMGQYKNNLALYLKFISEDPESQFYADLREQQNKDKEMTLTERKEVSDKIQQKLKTESDQGGIHKEVMENYIQSLAGYSVLTYILGIGDRHLENLMLEESGRMMHIDFGFILGKDPKPFPPPIKLCKEMYEAMCSEQNQTKFQQRCVDVYKYLRKYAKLIINLFILMVDSGIPDVTFESIKQMSEKFCIEQNDEAAESHFLDVLAQSVRALFAQINDLFHRWATYMRK